MVAELGAVSEQGKSAKMVVSIEKCIRQAVQSAAFGPEIRCGVRIDPGLWSVLVDEPQISQVLQTLLVNARQAMPAAGIVEIDTWNTRAAETLRPARYVAIRVTDHGPGVPRDQLNRIFEPDFTARQGGLVLATAHAIVANHGGTLVADSHGSSGLSFTIYLPASVTAASKPIPEPAPPKENHARILVMDDEQSIRELTGRMLSSVGFQVDTAEEGGDALRQYREAMEGGKPFDAVLLDLRVPLGMGGFEAFQAIRGLNPAVKAIISSGHAENPIMTNYRQHGIAAVVPKPYNVNELVTAVRQTVGSP
jgi:CheY-like chemotaxis protein